MQHERRKPATDQVASFLKIEKLGGKFDDQEDTSTIIARQALRLRTRFPWLAPATARAVAELHFGRALA